MKIVEATIVTPLFVLILSGIIMVTMEYFFFLYNDVNSKETEISEIYEDGEEMLLRGWDRIEELF